MVVTAEGVRIARNGNSVHRTAAEQVSLSGVQQEVGPPGATTTLTTLTGLSHA